MLVLRWLPKATAIHPENRASAHVVNFILYIGVMGTMISRCVHIYLSQETPETRTTESSEWGAMPYLTVCVDQSTENAMVLLQAFAVQGFGQPTDSNDLSSACSVQELLAPPDLPEIDGTIVDGTNGKCHTLDLTSWRPDFKGNGVNNVAIGGMYMNMSNASIPAKFLSVTASSHPVSHEDLKVFNPMMFVQPEPPMLGFGIPRVSSPVYTIEKQLLPFKKTPSSEFTWENLKDWIIAATPFVSHQRERYLATSMGRWNTCPPAKVVANQTIMEQLLIPGLMPFGFGIFVIKPTVTSTTHVTMLEQVVQLFSYFGGMLALAYIMHSTFFVPQPRKKTEDELLVLRCSKRAKRKRDDAPGTEPLLPPAKA